MYAAIFTVSLLLPAFEGIAIAIVSPFLIPLKTCVKIGKGKLKPLAKLLSPLSKKLVKSVFNTACLNLSVTVTWFVAFSTSSIVILS